MKKPVEDSEEFINLMKKWQAMEDKTISSAEELMKKTNNSFVKMAMELIKHDSEKHKMLQQMIIDSITKEAIHISPDELDALSDMLNSHMEAEAESLCIAEDAYKNCELFTTRFLLSYLIADEAKHHGLLSQFNELKRASIPTSVSARSYGYIERPPSDIERSHIKK
jgi:rubrerythrin